MTRWFLVLVCAALLQGQRPPIEEAWDRVASGQRTEAMLLLNRIIAANPRDADARLMLGSLLMEASRYQESIAQLSEAVRLRPNSAEAQNALGEAYSAAGDPRAARGPLEKAVAIDPSCAAAHVTLGLALLETGDLSGAATHLDRAIGLLGSARDAGYALYLRAKVHTERGEVERAAAKLHEAVGRQPDLAEAWSDLGAARKLLRDDAGALAAFERAVAINPDDAVARTRLGTAYLDAGRAHEAVDQFQEAVKLSPADQSGLNGLQRALQEDGQEQQATQVRRKLAEVFRAKRQSDQNTLAAIRINNEGADLEKAGNLRAAEEKYRAAHRLDPHHGGIQVNYAIALLRLGEWREGLKQLRDAAEREPGNALLKAALEDALTQAPVAFGGKGHTRVVAKSAGGIRY